MPLASPLPPTPSSPDEDTETPAEEAERWRDWHALERLLGWPPKADEPDGEAT